MQATTTLAGRAGDIGNTEQTDNTVAPGAPVTLDGHGRHILCTLCHDSDNHRYRVTLEADIAHVSLEGMNRFLVSVADCNNDNGQRHTLYAELEINLREALSSVAIAGGPRHYFTVTGRSLDPDSDDIDSSIHEAVDLGLMDFRVRAGARDKPDSALFDALSCNLLKGGISTLLARATLTHRVVILNAGHVFASRQDYIRDMCVHLARQADGMASRITGKALHCDQGLF